ncbi:hypothetical protein ACZ90_00310 [Streptomyces albus subsp. albus]|nr:hypothetical protein ACZ90_00310 [Streptomyces albus subsp. albus]
MSEYNFGYDEIGNQPDLGENNSSEQGPKWFRQGLSKLSSQVQELKAENDRLKAAQRQSQVADALKAKGYAPQAAGLFQGEPEKLDEWLTANGAALAKLPAAPGEQDGNEGGQPPAGPPTSTVPAEGQDQMMRMQEAGTQGVAPPQGSDKELAAAIAAAKTPEEFAQIMRAHGSPHDWT